MCSPCTTVYPANNSEELPIAAVRNASYADSEETASWSQVKPLHSLLMHELIHDCRPSPEELKPCGTQYAASVITETGQHAATTNRLQQLALKLKKKENHSSQTFQPIGSDRYVWFVRHHVSTRLDNIGGRW